MARFKPPLCGFSCAEISGKEAFDPMNDTFMKTKPVFPLLVSMALPNVISMLVNSLYNIVDSLFVAQINEQAMTALSLVFPIQNFVNAVAIGFGIGINALVALYRPPPTAWPSRCSTASSVRWQLPPSCPASWPGSPPTAPSSLWA